MKCLLFTGLLFCTLAGCGHHASVPSGILLPKDMQGLVRDLMRADVFVSDYVIRQDSSLDQTKEDLKYYNLIFSLHHISREGFMKSFSYYKTHPSLFKAMMDSISTEVVPVHYRGKSDSTDTGE